MVSKTKNKETKTRRTPSKGVSITKVKFNTKTKVKKKTKVPKKAVKTKVKKDSKKFQEIKSKMVDPYMAMGLALEIGRTIIDGVLAEVKKSMPNATFGPYKGKYAPHIVKYINTFMIEDANSIDNLEDAEKLEMATEVLYIEMFCKWLEEERGILPKESKVQKIKLEVKPRAKKSKGK